MKLIFVILFILVFLNFIPAIEGLNLRIEKQVEVKNLEYEMYNDYSFFNENQKENNYPYLKLHNFINYRISQGQYNEETSFNLQNDLVKRHSSECILKFETLINNEDYTHHDPIEIHKDDDFTFENGVTGGDGTENNPFIIEGWEIDTIGYAAILIEHTSLYFIVKNCLLKNATFGIGMFEISVGSISNCYIISNIYGIEISESTNIYLRNNILYDNKYSMEIYGSNISYYYHDIDSSNTINGKPVYYLIDEHDLIINENYDIGFLSLIRCKDILVTNLTISNCYDAVLLAGSSNITISSSNFLHSWYGIHFFESSNNKIIDCDIINASIFLLDSPNNVMRNSSIASNWSFSIVGLTLDAYYQDIDTSNTINGKPIYYLVGEENYVFKESNIGFLALVNCKNMIVENVKIENNMFGMLIAGTKATIKDCETSNNEVGLAIFGDCDLKINNFQTLNNMIGCLPFYASNIDFLNCNLGGFYGCIQIDYSHDITIKQCTFSNLYDDCITLRNSSNVVISNNEFPIIQAYYGIIFDEYSCGNTITHNKIYGGYLGIYVDGRSNNNTISYNDIYDLTNGGIWLYNCEDNIIHYNKIHNIGYDEHTAGISVYKSERCKINRNNIYDNYWGIWAIRCSVDATYNWWGSKNGPSGIGPGDGDWIEVDEANVLYEPWLNNPFPRNQQIIHIYPVLLLKFINLYQFLQQILIRLE